MVFSRRNLLIVLLNLGMGSMAHAMNADPPCDKYPSARQERCAEIWNELNKEDAPRIVQFGLDQQKRRDEGKIDAQQHLVENMTFINQSTAKRLERLKERMAKED